jgi:two-component system cell cycle response regulator DivK
MSKRILVVEDQEDNRQIIRDLLSATDYEITEAESGEQAVLDPTASAIGAPRSARISSAMLIGSGASSAKGGLSQQDQHDSWVRLVTAASGGDRAQEGRQPALCGRPGSAGLSAHCSPRLGARQDAARTHPRAPGHWSLVGQRPLRRPPWVSVTRDRMERTQGRQYTSGREKRANR